MSMLPQNPTARGNARPPCTNFPLATFFPVTDSVSVKNPNKTEVFALSVCTGCPLAARKACLREALDWPRDKQFGVVGGTTAAQRKAILRGRYAALLAGVAA